VPTESENSTTHKNKSAKKRLQVAPSPLNEVKLDIGLFILVGLILFLIVELVNIRQGLRFIVLGVWALSMLAWVVLKTQAIIKKTALQGNPLDNNILSKNDISDDLSPDTANRGRTDGAK